ncbi:glycosyltransferase family 2 protein [Thalassovita sp.]|uniref:glycosyltransferase family 2 protein n=1 Tax=Thalassovita sp. TaxID=1979401 RepID=UPI002B27628B|nr:glycosyltransferase family 2 protein [Thalassovita sp.]
MHSEVTIISVCYDSTSVLGLMLSSIPEGTPTIVVNNTQNDAQEMKNLAGQFGATVIQNDINRGFGFGCNQGAALADTQFLLFLNPDATLEPDTLDMLIQAAGKYEQASAFNPKILDSNGKPRFRRRSAISAKDRNTASGAPDWDCEVSVLSGAAMMVRRSDFEKVHGFDEKLFLYHEDEELSYRLRETCGPLMFIHTATVSHQGGNSSPNSLQVTELKAWHMARSGVYLAYKRGLRFPRLRRLVLATFQLVSPVCWFSVRKRKKQLAIFKGVLSSFSDFGAGYKDPS